MSSFAAFAGLLRLAPPPPVPLALEYAWQDVESHIELRLPEDFKAIVSLYGSGVFEPSGVRLCNFRSSRNECDLIIKQAQREVGSVASDELLFFPKPGGLLPFG